MANRVLVIGASFGAEVVTTILTKNQDIQVIGFVDDNQQKWGTEILGRPVFGGMSEIDKLTDEKKFDSAIISITSNLAVRRALFEKLKAKGCRFVNAIHEKAYIEPSAKIGEGNIIGAFAHVGTKTILGDNNLLSPYVDIEHHNILGSCTTFGPVCATSGFVKIGSFCVFGTGIFIQPCLEIGNNVKVASGSIILRNVLDNECIRAKLKLGDIHNQLSNTD